MKIELSQPENAISSGSEASHKRTMRRVSLQVVSVLLGTLGMTQAAKAQFVFGSFAGGNADGFGVLGSGGVTAFSPAADYTFVTANGSPGLQVIRDGFSSNDLAFDFASQGDLPELLANDVLSFQVTFPSATTIGTSAGFSQVYSVDLNGPGTGYTQIGPGTPVNQYYYSGFGGSTQTFSFNYDALKSDFSLADGYDQLTITTNAGGGSPNDPDQLIFQNFELTSIPEPGSLSLLTVGAAALIGRRRSRIA